MLQDPAQAQPAAPQPTQRAAGRSRQPARPGLAPRASIPKRASHTRSLKASRRRNQPAPDSRKAPAQGDAPGSRRATEGEEFVLQGFDLGDGRYEDLSFERIQQAVAIAGSLRDRDSDARVARQHRERGSREEFGAATPHYAQVTQIAGQPSAVSRPGAAATAAARSREHRSEQSRERDSASRPRCRQYNAHQAQLAQGRQMAGGRAEARRTSRRRAGRLAKTRRWPTCSAACGPMP